MENLGTFPLATINVVFNLPALYFTIVLALAIVVLSARRWRRQRQLDRALQRISDAITEYFGKTGIEVSVSCFDLFKGKRFVAVIESEPIKKFRHSYIIEQVLVKHLARTTGLQVEKIYWRFPFPAVAENVAGATTHAVLADPYHAEGPAKVWAQRDYRVEETSWENYEKASHTTPPDDVGPPKP